MSSRTGTRCPTGQPRGGGHVRSARHPRQPVVMRRPRGHVRCLWPQSPAGGSCASFTKKPSDSDHSRWRRTSRQRSACLLKYSARLSLPRPRAMLESATASPYMTELIVGRQPSRPAEFSSPSAWPAEARLVWVSWAGA